MIKQIRQHLDLTALLFVVVLGATACTTFFRSVVTLTEVVHSAEQQYRTVYREGLVSAEVHEKAIKAHEQYRAAAKTAEEALIAYKASGEQVDYLRAFEAAKVAAFGFIDRIVPLLTAENGTKLKTNLLKASEL